MKKLTRFLNKYNSSKAKKSLKTLLEERMYSLTEILSFFESIEQRIAFLSSVLYYDVQTKQLTCLYNISSVLSYEDQSDLSKAVDDLYTVEVLGKFFMNSPGEYVVLQSKELVLVSSSSTSTLVETSKGEMLAMGNTIASVVQNSFMGKRDKHPFDNIINALNDGEIDLHRWEQFLMIEISSFFGSCYTVLDIISLILANGDFSPEYTYNLRTGLDYSDLVEKGKELISKFEQEKGSQDEIDAEVVLFDDDDLINAINGLFDQVEQTFAINILLDEEEDNDI